MQGCAQFSDGDTSTIYAVCREDDKAVVSSALQKLGGMFNNRSIQLMSPGHPALEGKQNYSTGYIRRSAAFVLQTDKDFTYDW